MQEVNYEVVIENYTFTAISGKQYHPTIKDGKWYVSPMAGPVTFFDVVYLCNIPDDEAFILRLKYGG